MSPMSDGPSRERGWVGPVGAVPATAVAIAPLVLLAAALVFDLQSQRSGQQFLYARGGFVLSLMGLACGLLAGLLLALRLTPPRARPTPSRNLVAVLVLLVAALACFAVRLAARWEDSLVPVPVWVLVVELIAQVGSVACVVYGVRCDQPSVAGVGRDTPDGAPGDEDDGPADPTGAEARHEREGGDTSPE